jgi:2'-5' RNA ligase
MEPTPGQHWRLFIALLLPEEVQQGLARAQDDLRSRIGSTAAGWTRPEQFHLTLKFLGNVNAVEVPTLSESLCRAFATFSPLQITCAGTGFFPNARRPRIVWAGLSGLEYALGSLHAAAEGASAPFTKEEPENRFHAHVTIARVKLASPALSGEMAQWSEHYQNHIFGTWKGSEIALMKSQLSPKGATYSAVSSFALRNAG